MNKGLDASKKVVHKAGKCLEHYIADAVLSKTLSTQTNSSDHNIEKQEPVWETIIPPEKGKEILNKLKKVLKNGAL